MDSRSTEELIAASLDAIEQLHEAQADLNLLEQRNKTMLVETQAQLDTIRDNQPDRPTDLVASSPPSDSE